MRAMILAAGRGERMGALTEQVPKPLLKIAGKYLIAHTIEYLQRAGIYEIVINISYLGEQIKVVLGNGNQFGVSIVYSEEKTRLETGGGIFQALPLLGHDPFIVMSSDIVTDFPLASLPTHPKGLAHLVLVDNPSFHPQGDFGLSGDDVDLSAVPRKTFANIGVYRPELFSNCEPGYFPLNKLLFPAIEQKQVTGELYHGEWYNIGTPQQLLEMNERIC